MNRTIYNIQYNIPRVMVQFPGRQNRLSDDDLRITPGMTEVFEFQFGNQDGVPINLLPFQIKLVFWSQHINDKPTLSAGQSDIVLAKNILVDDPYSGVVTVILDDDDTFLLGESGSSLRWSLFMINEEQQVFPTQVSRYGGRYGTVRMDVESGMPIAELIRNA